jgi:hypothetical protein
MFTEPSNRKTDRQTDGRDLWNTPLGWAGLSWHTYLVPYRLVQTFRSWQGKRKRLNKLALEKQSKKWKVCESSILSVARQRVGGHVPTAFYAVCAGWEESRRLAVAMCSVTESEDRSNEQAALFQLSECRHPSLQHAEQRPTDAILINVMADETAATACVWGGCAEW